MTVKLVAPLLKNQPATMPPIHRSWSAGQVSQSSILLSGQSPASVGGDPDGSRGAARARRPQPRGSGGAKANAQVQPGGHGPSLLTIARREQSVVTSRRRPPSCVALKFFRTGR